MPVGVGKIFGDSWNPQLEKHSKWTYTNDPTANQYGISSPVRKGNENLVMAMGGLNSSTTDFFVVTDKPNTFSFSTWTKTVVTGLPLNTAMADLTYSPTLDRWCMVGAGFGAAPVIMTSDNDGVTWTTRTNPASPLERLYAVHWADGKFVAVGGRNFSSTSIIWTSTDGITWTVRTSPKSTWGLYAVTYFKGLWVAAGEFETGFDTYCVTSSDAITWTERSVTSPASQAQAINALIDNFGVLRSDIAGYQDTADTTDKIVWKETEDGINWVAREDESLQIGLSGYNALHGGFHRGIGFAFREDSGIPSDHVPIIYSKDNQTWRRCMKKFGANDVVTQYAEDVESFFPQGNDLLFYNDELSGNDIAEIRYIHNSARPTGPPSSWTDVANFFYPIRASGDDYNIYNAFYWGKKGQAFYIVGWYWANLGNVEPQIWATTDGKFAETRWQGTVSGAELRGVTGNDTTLVAVGEDGSGDMLVMTMTDSQQPVDNSPSTPAFEEMYDVEWGAGKFVSVGLNGKFAHSTDGITWTEGNLPAATWAFKIHWDGTNFIAGGDYNVTKPSLYYSSNGTTWTDVGAVSGWPGTNDWQDVAHGVDTNGVKLHVFVGNSGTVVTARDITSAASYTSRVVTAIGTSQVSAVCYAAGYWILGTSDGKVYYTDDPEDTSAYTAITTTGWNGGNAISVSSIAYDPDGGRIVLFYYTSAVGTTDNGMAWIDIW